MSVKLFRYVTIAGLRLRLEDVVAYKYDRGKNKTSIYTSTQRIAVGGDVVSELDALFAQGGAVVTED